MQTGEACRQRSLHLNAFGTRSFKRRVGMKSGLFEAIVFDHLRGRANAAVLCATNI